MSLWHIRVNLFKATQEKFAKAIGFDQAAISRWENGLAYPDFRQLTKIRTVAKRKYGDKWSDSLFWQEK